MNGTDHARMLLQLARDDLKALTGMSEVEVFTDAIFGFHAQQAVEKGLKAWLAGLDVLFPSTHDLSRLVPLLAEQGIEVDELWEWIALTPFAVQHRYSWPEAGDDPLDRGELVSRITRLLDEIDLSLRFTPS